MSTPKENFLRLINWDNPKWMGDPWDCMITGLVLGPAVFDGMVLAAGNPMPGETKTNNFGITWTWPLGDPGMIPVNDPDKVCVKDITEWKKYVKYPDVKQAPWDAAFGMLAASLKLPGNAQYISNPDAPLGEQIKELRQHKLLLIPMFMGPFEYSHEVMNFEDALCNYMLEPEAMSDMIGAYMDWYITAFDETFEHMHPDIVMPFDDWGNQKNTFINPETWREVIKPHLSRLYKHITDKGVIIIQHSDCVIGELVEDLVDMGVKGWQGAIPANDIPDQIKRTNGKLLVMGGLDMQLIDREDAPEEVIRQHVRDVIDKYAPLGHFVPVCTSVTPLNERTGIIMNDEMNKYGAEWAAKNF